MIQAEARGWQLGAPTGDPPMTIFDSPRQRAFALIAILGLAILLVIGPFVPGLIGVAVLHVLFAPSYRWAQKYLPAGPAALVVSVVAALVLLLPGSALVAVMIDQAPQILRRAQETSTFERLAALQIGPIHVGQQVAQASTAIVSWLSQQASAFFGSATRATLNLFLALFGLYYLLQSSDALWGQFRLALPFSDAATEQLRARFYRVTRATMLGALVTALLQGSIVGLAFLAVGLANPLFWGVITACASVLPVLGSSLVWLPGVAVLLADARYGPALALALVGFLVASNVDNVVRPLIFQRVGHIHPMISLVGAFAGVNLFGLVGLLLGPLALVYFFELASVYREEYGRA
jgi:predicted PurR-regulated permease PerM